MVINLLRWFAFFWIAILAIGTLYTYIGFKTDSSFLQLKHTAVAGGYYLPAFFCHVLGSSIILVTGFFQFLKPVYSNRPLHRKLGKVYVFGVLFFSAPGAYIMTAFIDRGAGVFISFFLQNTLWIIFTVIAWRYAVTKKINNHVDMMRRSYALAFAAVTLRFYIFMFTLLGNGVNFEHNYVIIALLSWIPNLVLVEIINWYDKRQYY
jgi:hypothetical protein